MSAHLSVSLTVRESVYPKYIVNTISVEPVKGISPNFGHKCIFGFIDVLIRLWKQKVKGQGHSRWSSPSCCI